MAYRIVYGPMPPVSREKNYKFLRIQMLTALFLLLFVLLVRQAWPEGTAVLRSMLLPGEPTVTEAAFSEMVIDIQSGEPVREAFTAFCRQIVDDGIQTID